MPNGLAFSPDEKRLYVADSGKPRHIRAFDVSADGRKITGGDVFAKIDPGAPDGIRVDSAGRVWSTAGDGVHVFSPDGKLIGKILVPETPANLCFGGDKRNELYITAKTSLYRIKLAASSTAGPRADAHDVLVKRVIALMNATAADLKGATDGSTVAAATPKIRARVEAFKELRTSAERLPQLTADEDRVVRESNGRDFSEALSKVESEIKRVCNTPALDNAQMRQALGELLSTK
jgi:DNA-binding beta-propeller fold protein YncE